MIAIIITIIISMIAIIITRSWVWWSNGPNLGYNSLHIYDSQALWKKRQLAQQHSQYNSGQLMPLTQKPSDVGSYPRPKTSLYRDTCSSSVEAHATQHISLNILAVGSKVQNVPLLWTIPNSLIWTGAAKVKGTIWKGCTWARWPDKIIWKDNLTLGKMRIWKLVKPHQWLGAKWGHCAGDESGRRGDDAIIFLTSKLNWCL